MSDTKMLQAIINGQKALEERLMGEIGKVRSDVKRVEVKVDKNGKRIDKLGLQLAYLEDDAPTREEFDDLDKRVKKIENKLVS